MIVSTDPNGSYHTLIVADYHMEYPLQGVARIMWDPDAIEEVMTALNVTDVNLNMTCSMLFGDLPRRYNGGYPTNDGATLYRIHGTYAELNRVYDDLAQQLMGGPRGADDDTFDYWPNAFDMLFVLAQDLIKLSSSNHQADWIFATFTRVIDSAIALEGPPSEWEADFLDTNLNSLRHILDERKEA